MKKLLGESHEDQIVLFDPACASQNIGDEIISSSAQKWLCPLFPDNFITRVSTHQKMSFRYRRFLRDSKVFFALGSNLLKSGMLFGFRQWDISLIDTLQVHDVILVGCGWHAYEKRTDAYSRILYRRLLSNHHLHSVRDDYTKEFCADIPREKAPHVIAAVTDYDQDPVRDEQMLATLLRRYETVSVWLQGSGDRRYASTLPSFSKCKVIPSTLSAFDEALSQNDVDYVGTRLHGGIRALQHGRRTLIVSIDNRAREKQRDFNIPAIERDDIGQLEDWICGSQATKICIPTQEIQRFLEQFKS